MKSLYVVYDNQAHEVGRVAALHRADAAAIREFTDLLNNRDTMVGQHPEDYELLKIATIDETTGEITPVDRTAMVVTTGRAWAALQDTPHQDNKEVLAKISGR